VAPDSRWVVVATLASSAALIANVALMAAAPYLISKATLVTGFAAVSLAVTAVRALAIARAALRYAERYTVHLASLRIMTRLRVSLFRAIEPLTPGGLRSLRSGDLLARMVADVDTLDGFFVRGLVPPIAALLSTAAACAILGSLRLGLGAALLVFLAFAACVVPLAARSWSRRPAGRLIRARAELHAELAEDLPGLADLLASGRDGRLGERLGRASGRIEREQRRLASVRGANAALGSALAGIAGLTVLAMAIPLVRSGDMSGVFLATVPLVAMAAFEAVQPLGSAFEWIESGRASALRTFELIEAPPVVREPHEPRTPPPNLDLEFRHVGFRYTAGAPPVLDDLTFRLTAGAHLGITGPSGAGKTTIVSLLLRFFDAETGAVLIGGWDVRGYPSDAVRALIGVVPQHVFLFNATLRDNLLVADGTADDDRIVEACAKAELKDLLDRLPSGLDTLVGEDGLRLSGGERQRVALARAFLKDAPILVLDEATANLDGESEDRVLRQVRTFARDKTMLVISHRPAPLGLADQVLELASGDPVGVASTTEGRSPHE
jgi:ATP-binding cassette subfamily C protein CydC